MNNVRPAGRAAPCITRVAAGIARSVRLGAAQWREANKPCCPLLLPPRLHPPHDLNEVIAQSATTIITSSTPAETLKEFAADPRIWERNLASRRSSTGDKLLCPRPSPLYRYRRWRAWTDALDPQQKRGFLFPVRALATMFRGKFLARLAAASRTGKLVSLGPVLLTSPGAWQRLLRSTPNLDRLRQSPAGWASSSPELPRPLHLPDRDLERTAPRLPRRRSPLPLQGLRPRPCPQGDDLERY